MTETLVKSQLHAFLWLLVAVVIVAIAPILVTGIMGKVVPDSLIAMSDKTVIGLIGILGTLVGVMWRRNSTEPSGTPADPVNVASVDQPA